MIIYLCGAINGCADSECRDWREFVKCEFKEFQFLDPMRRDYRGKEDFKYREIVELDKIDVANSDVILVSYLKPSVGTSMEILYAWQLGKRIILISPVGENLSPWLRYHSTHIVHSLDAAFQIIKKIS